LSKNKGIILKEYHFYSHKKRNDFGFFHIFRGKLLEIFSSLFYIFTKIEENKNKQKIYNNI